MPHDDGILFEMASLREDRTGLPFYVWLSHRGGSKHDVRLKISPGIRYNPDGEIVVGLRPDFHYIHGSLDRKNDNLLRRWVVLNIDTIITFWNEEIDDDDMKSRIQKI